MKSDVNRYGVELKPSNKVAEAALFIHLSSPCRGVQPFGVSRPHWKNKSCLGPHIKYTVTYNHKTKSHYVLSKFTILCWAAFIALLSCMQPVGTGWTPLILYLSLCSLSSIK